MASSSFVADTQGAGGLVTHTLACQMYSLDPKHINILKFIEQDRGLVNWLTMPFIPKERRWSSVTKVQCVPKDFISEEKCQYDANKGKFRLQ